MDFMIKAPREDIERYIDISCLISNAEKSLEAATVHITDHIAPLSKGTAHDYYSNGDYWWPNPDTPNQLPFVRRDGRSYPGIFTEHRKAVYAVRDAVGSLVAGYQLTGDERYAKKAIQFLKEFFLDEKTRMNPNLLYAQAIPGICDGRGIGIIDTIHMIDLPVAIDALKASPHMTEPVMIGLIRWFGDYLNWMQTHPNGIEEMNEHNNHAVTWHVQAAIFARFVNDTETVTMCSERFKNILLPNQMAHDGSLPAELRRTKPYAYSNFTLDTMVYLCHILSTNEDNLWEFTLPDGRSIRRGIEFLYPYIEDIDKWPYEKDVEHFEQFPAAMPFLLLAGYAYGYDSLKCLYAKLALKYQNGEVSRNVVMKQPFLWLRSGQNYSNSQ